VISMKIAMISGTPSIRCGVSDYTKNLVQALNFSGANVEIFAEDPWHFDSLQKFQRFIRTFSPDVIHYQYPAAAYGKIPYPQFLLLWNLFQSPSFVTLHEYVHTHPLRKFSSSIFAFARHIVFTNLYECSAFSKNFHLDSSRSSIIPLGSAIPAGTPIPKHVGQIMYFGLIRPNRGLEDFLSLAHLSKTSEPPLHFVIAGSKQSSGDAYVSEIQKSNYDLKNVEWVFEPTPAEVSRMFRESDIAYLPYPDGASERRSSLIAALSNASSIITTRGDQTPPDFDDKMLFAKSPEHALELVKATQSDRSRLSALSLKAGLYAKKFDWANISEMHLKLYKKSFR
jgi:glycosyltransferase involved in cell wall biosynthesis